MNTSRWRFVWLKACNKNSIDSHFFEVGWSSNYFGRKLFLIGNNYLSEDAIAILTHYFFLVIFTALFQENIEYKFLAVFAFQSGLTVYDQDGSADLFITWIWILYRRTVGSRFMNHFDEPCGLSNHFTIRTIVFNILPSSRSVCLICSTVLDMSPFSAKISCQITIFSLPIHSQPKYLSYKSIHFGCRVNTLWL